MFIVTMDFVCLFNTEVFGAAWTGLVFVNKQIKFSAEKHWKKITAVVWPYPSIMDTAYRSEPAVEYYHSRTIISFVIIFLAVTGSLWDLGINLNNFQNLLFANQFFLLALSNSSLQNWCWKHFSPDSAITDQGTQTKTQPFFFFAIKGWRFFYCCI